MQQERLAKYSFVRTDYDPTSHRTAHRQLGTWAVWQTAPGLIISKLWGADLWKEDNERRAVDGSGLVYDGFSVSNKPATYRQELGLGDGVLKTRVLDSAGCGYEAEMFCSMADRHLIVLQVKNLGGVGENLACCSAFRRLHRDQAGAGSHYGTIGEAGYTRDAWAIRLSKPYTIDSQGRESVKLAPGESDHPGLFLDHPVGWRRLLAI